MCSAGRGATLRARHQLNHGAAEHWTFSGNRKTRDCSLKMLLPAVASHPKIWTLFNFKILKIMFYFNVFGLQERIKEAWLGPQKAASRRGVHVSLGLSTSSWLMLVISVMAEARVVCRSMAASLRIEVHIDIKGFQEVFLVSRRISALPELSGQLLAYLNCSRKSCRLHKQNMQNKNPPQVQDVAGNAPQNLSDWVHSKITLDRFRGQP